MRRWSFVVLVACAEEDPAASLFPVDEAPPPLVLTAEPLVPGQPFTLQADGAPAGARVSFVYGTGAGSSCPPPLGGTCLSVANPVLIGGDAADANGHAEATFTLPATAPVGLVVPFQAAIGGTSPLVSNVDVRTIQAPTPASDDFRVHLVRAVIRSDPPGSAGTWDDYAIIPPFTNPDVFVEIALSGVVVGATFEVEDDLSPAWGASTVLTVFPGDTLSLTLYDADIAPLPDDLIRAFVLTRAQLDAMRGAGDQTVSGGPVTSFVIRVEDP
jgi:hypothetical protein